MTCKLLNDAQTKEWQAGKQFELSTDGYKLPVNFLTCSTYFFNGQLNCVTIPSGAQMYAYGAKWVDDNVEYPFDQFYVPKPSAPINYDQLTKKVTSNDESVEYNLSSQIPVNATLFTDEASAKANAECGEACVLAYELTKPVTLVLLDDYNVWRLYNSKGVSQSIKDAIGKMYGFKSFFKPKLTTLGFGKVAIDKLQRVKSADTTNAFATWVCNTLGYDGYAFNVQIDGNGKKTYDMEIMFCNCTRYLKRQTANVSDWQHVARPPSPNVVQKLLDQMAYYKFVDVDLNAGNLSELTVWTLLFCESIVANDSIRKPDDNVKKFISSIAILHATGAMNPATTTARKRDKICAATAGNDYGSKSAEYVSGVDKIPILDENAKVVDYFKIDELLSALQISKNAQAVATIYRNYGKFAERLKYVKDDDDADVYAQNYLNEVTRMETKWYYPLITLSTARILALQPYGTNSSVKTNAYSKYYPFVSNVPKRYRGSLPFYQAPLLTKFVERIYAHVGNYSLEAGESAARPLIPLVRVPQAANVKGVQELQYAQPLISLAPGAAAPMVAASAVASVVSKPVTVAPRSARNEIVIPKVCDSTTAPEWLDAIAEGLHMEYDRTMADEELCGLIQNTILRAVEANAPPVEAKEYVVTTYKYVNVADLPPQDLRLGVGIREFYHPSTEDNVIPLPLVKSGKNVCDVRFVTRPQMENFAKLVNMPYANATNDELCSKINERWKKLV